MLREDSIDVIHNGSMVPSPLSDDESKANLSVTILTPL